MKLEGANLSGARMERAELIQARMEGADLRGARMEGADLREARMEGAYLREARMADSECTAAAFLAAAVHSGDLTCRNLTQAQLQYTVGDADTRLPPGLHVWSCLDRTSLPEEIAGKIEAALARYPEEGGWLVVSRAAFEWLLFCDPDHEDPLRRDQYPLPPPVGRPQ